MKNRTILMAILTAAVLLSLCAASCRKPKEETTAEPTTVTEAPTEASREETTAAREETTAEPTTVTEAPTEAPTEEPTEAPTETETEAPSEPPTDDGEGGMEVIDDYTIDVSENETGGGL